MPEQPLRVGVIGAAEGEAVHIPGLRQVPGVDVVAVCAAAGEPLGAVAARYQIPARFDDFRAMLREAALDAVTIAAPLELHHPIAVAAAERQLHILCGAPMARSAAEARDMHRLVCSLGVRHAVGYAARYLPLRVQIKQLVEHGYLGDLQSVSVAVWRASGQRRKPDSLVQEVGSEYVDALRWWFGEIHGVVGAAAAPAPGDVSASQPQANFAMIVQFAGGAVGSIHASASMPLGDKVELTAVGTAGMLTARDGKLFGARRDEPVLAEIPLPDELAQSVQQAPDPRVGPFARLAHDWVRSIAERDGDGRAPTFADGMRVQEIVDGAMKSQELGRWIDTSGKKWPV